MSHLHHGYLPPKYYTPNRYYDSMHISSINNLLLKYKEIARYVKQPDWYVKGVALYFTYDKEVYVIYPWDMGISREIFEILSNRLADDLYTLGAFDIHYTGELD